MAWILITAGIVAILSAIITTAHRAETKPKWHLRLAMSLAGVYFVYLGLHRLGVIHFQ